jgi:hypothetical protein
MGEFSRRGAELVLEKAVSGPVLTARVPMEMSGEEFLEVAKSSYELISRLTGCNCMSGRISFVVDDLYNEVVRVDFGRFREAQE